MTQEVMNNILDLLTEVAAEQATREFSGINWFEQFAASIEKVRKEINTQTQTQ